MQLEIQNKFHCKIVETYNESKRNITQDNLVRHYERNNKATNK